MEESYMKDKSIPRVISHSLPYFLFIIIFFFQINTGWTQIEIKERVVIHPGGTNDDIFIDPYGAISGDPNNPVYLRYGGEVIMQLLSHYNQTTAWHDTRLGEEDLGEIARYKDQFEEVNVGTFPQWQKLQFWVSDSIKLPDMQREKFYPLGSSSEIVDEILGFLDFLLHKVQPNDTIDIHMTWSIKLNKNDSLAAMPPPEILNYFGNPYVPSQEIIIPADGMVFMTIERVYSDVLVDLYQDVPDNQLLLNDLESHEWETINFGRKSAGDSLRFYIRSGHTVVNGMNLYPETYDNEYLSYYDGSVLFKDIWFEDWTDLLFNDIYCSLYLIPDNLADFPWSLDVELSPSVIAPGDTAQVILKWRNPDGSLESFPDTMLFDVEVLSGYEYGDLYSPIIPYTFDFNFGIPQGFSFISEDSIDVDSVWVSIWVGSSGGISSAVSQRKPSEMAKEQFEEAKTKKLTEKNKPAARGEPLIKLGNTDNNSGVGYTIEEDDYPPFFMGIGEVLITKEDSLDHFTVFIEPDTVAPGESAIITAIAKDVNNNEIDLDDTTLLVVTIDSVQYGSFISADGDTVDSPLDSILYSDARSNLIRFFANDSIDLDSSEHLIKVEVVKKDEPNKKGMGNVVISEKSITITMEFAKPEIWPTLPGGNYSGRNSEDNNIDTVTIKVQQNGEPVNNKNVDIKIRIIPGTGGHDHTNIPPNGLLGMWTNFSVNPPVSNFCELTSQTNQNGELILKYKSPEFGGKFEIVARTIFDQDTIRTKDTLIIRVPNLAGLDSGTNYELVGTPNNHANTNDPCRPDPPTSLHYRNHYGTQSLVSAIRNIADAYSRAYPGVKIRVNDMSLEYGGLFDTKNDWRNGHTEHRIGKQVDISYRGIDQNNDCIDLNRQRIFGPIRRYTNQNTFIHETHYHVRVR
jgi:hypothetical protein